MPEAIELPAATPSLATAGTGDVIAATASYLHATAATWASKGAPLTATGLIHALTEAVRQVLHGHHDSP